MRWPLVPVPNVIALVVTTTALWSYCLGAAIQGADDLVPSPAVGWIEESKTIARLQTNNPSLDDFTVCTDLDGPFAPFCLPQDGADVVVDATYYVTWNVDFYPLNASITIEMRYSNSTVGDLAFTSEKIDNSYGYLPLYMRKEWLQEKAQNDLALYLIELNPASGTRASIRKGPMITLNPKPVEHYKPSPTHGFQQNRPVYWSPAKPQCHYHCCSWSILWHAGEQKDWTRERYGISR